MLKKGREATDPFFFFPPSEKMRSFKQENKQTCHLIAGPRNLINTSSLGQHRNLQPNSKQGPLK